MSHINDEMEMDGDTDKPIASGTETTSRSNTPSRRQSQARTESPSSIKAQGSAPVAKRKPHSKSRLGCQQCKQRKVKCDETKPSCKKCVRNDTECSFLKLQPNIFRPLSSQKVIQQPSPPVHIASTPSQTSISTKLDGFIPIQPDADSPPQLLPKPIHLPLPELLPQRGPKTPENFYDSPQAATLSPTTSSDVSGRPSSAETGHYDLLDMQLYHHYMVKTSLSMCETQSSAGDGEPQYNHGIKEIWHHVFTEMAFKHDFLMHALLSLSAFHMSSLQRHREMFWLSVKTKHQELGIKRFRFAVSNMTKQNVHACWAFSLVLSMTEKPGIMCDFEGIENGTGFVALMRGGIRTYDPFMADIVEGPMKAFFVAWTGRVATRFDMDPEDIRRLDRVSDYWGYDAPAHIRAQSQVLEEALEHLRGSFAMCTSDTNLPLLGPVMSWAGLISDEFMQLVLTKDTGALIVLAHFCVLISRLKAWWLSSEAETLLNSVMKHINRADEHWIVWPIEQVFHKGYTPALGPKAFNNTPPAFYGT